MSQKVSRKSNMNEEKEKRQTVSPAKDVKKKVNSSTDKEKQPTEKPEKQAEKQTDKKQAEKIEKQTDKKHVEKSEKQPDKSTEKITDKKEKTTEKKDTQGEKSKEDGAKEEKIAKNDLHDEKERPQLNGQAIVQNGVGDVTNGKPSEPNGTVSGGDSDDDDVTLVIDDDHDQDEMFPELAYDDTSDTEGFELPTADSATSRSLTRRSQVKATRTPETPRPASEKQTDKEIDSDPNNSKVLKLKEDAPGSDRKLRSSDSPKPQEVKKSQEPAKKQEKPLEPVAEKESSDKEQEKAEQEVTKEQINSGEEVKEAPVESENKKEPFVQMIDIIEEAKKNEKDVAEKNQEESVNVIEVVIEVEPDIYEEKEEPRKVDTNYSKSRVKVSPYRRSSRIADQTVSSMLANYTGNNTTMEMDITETSLLSEREGSPPVDDGSYLRGLRSIRARNSYKKLAHVSLTNLANRSARSSHGLGNTPGVESRPTAPVVGRKRRPEADREPPEHQQHRHSQAAAPCKRMRLLDRIAYPFRRNLPHALPSASPDIVGINTDLPLTAPVASADTFDPETLKAAPPPPPPPAPTSRLTAPAPRPAEPLATPLGAHDHQHGDSKRCVIM